MLLRLRSTRRCPQALIQQAPDETFREADGAHFAKRLLRPPTAPERGRNPNLLTRDEGHERSTAASDAMSCTEEQRQGAHPRQPQSCTERGVDAPRQRQSLLPGRQQ